MRTDIVHIGAGELTYEIRNIVNVGQKLVDLGIRTHWENIGDPIAKGEKIPVWMKEIVADFAMQDLSYGYCPTRGMLATREFIANQVNARGRVQICADDILFLMASVMRSARSSVFCAVQPGLLCRRPAIPPIHRLRLPMPVIGR